MTEFSNSQLRRLDLTLLLVFLGLVRQRKAAEVAAALGMTQSGVSQALKRLRDIFGDPLFLRRPYGLEPTALALALEPELAAAVQTLRGALGAAQAFEPATAEGVVRIAAPDAEQAVLVPPLAARLAQHAPGLRIIVLPLVRQAAIDALDDGRADLALGFVAKVPEPIRQAGLYVESFRVVGRPDTMPEAPLLALADYLAGDHILVSPAGELSGVVDTELAARGLRRRVVLALPAFLPALAAAAATGCFATLPTLIAQHLAGGFGLTVAQVPIPVRQFRVSVHWHRRNDRDARLQWVRAQMTTVVAADLGLAGP